MRTRKEVEKDIDGMTGHANSIHAELLLDIRELLKEIRK